MPDFYEFFAGGGMARAGLAQGWRCLFANDVDQNKSHVYRCNWQGSELRTADVASLKTSDLPGRANLAWASFPCQDLSLAGTGAGLKGKRSSTFWPFWNLIRGLSDEKRAPDLIVLENVCGTLTSHAGKDFATICDALGLGGYRCGAMVINALHFVPQSRPRLFIICTRQEVAIPDEIVEDSPTHLWHPPALIEAHKRLSTRGRANWVWWNLPQPRKHVPRFADLIDDDPSGVEWHKREQTDYLLSLMSPRNFQKVQSAKRLNLRVIGAVYRRTRQNENGDKTQRAEVRFDDIAGCLRTPRGGSSRQTILVVEGPKVRSRLLSPREAARLMGLPDSYRLPENYNSAYQVVGDGVVVPVVRYISRHILEKIVASETVGGASNAA
jgi:DNA (cytosine-5)-methyltransferase 1